MKKSNNQAQITLASKSPRRADLLKQIGICFDTRVSDIEEVKNALESPEDYVQRLALSKATSCYRGLLPTLGADTTVVHNGLILEKPKDQLDAQQMLAQLQGQRHTVLTAISLVDSNVQETILAKAEVKFREISNQEILQYCSTPEPFDKAGAYGIQGIGAVFIAAICGQPSTVAGLPLVETNSLLIQFGVDVWKHRIEKGLPISDG